MGFATGPHGPVGRLGFKREPAAKTRAFAPIEKEK